MKASYKYLLSIGVSILAVGGLIAYSYQLQGNIESLESSLSQKNLELEESKKEQVLLSEAFENERNKNTQFEEQINGIASTVGKLDKLSKLDAELLQKYSKVYFLNEHHTPKLLSSIPSDYLLQPERNIELHSEVLPYLEEMIAAARSNGVELRIVSGYRSYGEQANLKGNYTFTYGSGANTFSADQGYSEHQLGTTVDITNIQLGANFTEFGETEAYQWLLENAYRYGFVLSYPENNSYYQFEPWHWRFVGTLLAERLHEEGEHFYDLDQRKIDAYLIHIFD